MLTSIIHLSRKMASSLPKWTRVPWVSVVPNTEGKMQISCTHAVKDRPRVYNVLRKFDEPVQSSFTRLQKNMVAQLDKKKKKKKHTANDNPAHDNPAPEPDLIVEMAVEMAIYKDGKLIDPEVSNEVAWQNQSILHVQDSQYEIQVNPPICDKVVIPSVLMSGLPVHANIELSFCERDACKFTWLLSGKPVTAKVMRGKSQFAKDEWIEVGDTLEYIPKESDVGHVLRFACQPIRGSLEGEVVESHIEEIQAGAGPYPFEKRHEHTTKRCGEGRFRVMSYNILADTYVDSQHSREVLFASCPHEYLKFDYRKQLIIKEILGYHGDILCLQEVDSSYYRGTLSQILDRHGFEGHFNAKPERDEGTAIFYNINRFKLLSKHDIDMMQWFQEDASCTQLLEKVKSNDAFQELALSRKTEVQVCVLENLVDPARNILVANTHLFWHPRANNIRNIQIAIVAQHIHNIVDMYSKNNQELSVVLCGDLNSGPHSGVFQYLQDGSLPASHADWYCYGREMFVPEMTMEHCLDLTCASGTPRYTNYVAGFQGCLDYIFIASESLQCERILAMPSHDDVIKHTAIPNVVFPSDHLASVCDIAWK